MKKRLIALVIFLTLLILLLIIILKQQGYDIKIILKCDNLSAEETDEMLTKQSIDILLQIPEINEVLAYSRQNETSIYCKINPLSFKKTIIKEKIKNEIQLFVNNINKEVEIISDDKYDTVYNCFIVVYSDKINHFSLKKYTDNFEDEILNLNITTKFLNVSPYEIANYIYFTPNIQREFNLDINNLKKIILDNNSDTDSGYLSNQKSIQNYNLNSKLNNIDDIKNLALYYKDKNFSTKFKDVFKIEEDVKKPFETIIFYGKNAAQIYALKPKGFYPNFIFKNILNKKISTLEKKYPSYIHFDFLTNFKQVRIYLNENSNIEKSIELYQKLKEIDNSAIFIIGNDFVKTKKGTFVNEKEQNKITLLLKNNKIIDYLKKEKINYILGNEKTKEYIKDDINSLYSEIENKKNKNFINPTTNKSAQISYIIDKIALNDYQIEQNELENTIRAMNEGVICTKYFKGTSVIPVILKNNEINEGFIYSPDYKTLISLKSIAKKQLQKKYSVIVHKNNRYYAKLFFLK